MHSALLIDEILRHVFSFCSENRSSLVSAARVCEAWKGPALDFIWNRLSSFEPLLQLLNVSMVEGEYVLMIEPSKQDLHRFNSYAPRIKHVSNRRELKIHPSLAESFLFSGMKNSALPNLSTAHICLSKSAACLIPLNFSPNLVRLEVDLGFKETSCSMNDTLCKYLETTNINCSELRHLSLRGLSSKRLNDIISKIPNLESISLRLGATLLPQTLKATMHSPRLSELEIHAGHIDLNDIHDAYNTHTQQAHTIFTSLTKLHIRAEAALIENILQYIPPNTLQHLHMELDSSLCCPTFWDTCFASISSKTTDTLRHLSLEHHFEILEPAPSSNPAIASQTTVAGVNVSGIPFQTMERLRNLKQLRHFSCDLTLPPSLNDQDLQKIVTWWPDLRHFELGSSLIPDEFEIVTPPQMTLACLLFFSSQMTKLKNLILPLAICDPLPLLPDVPQPVKSNELQSLTITHLETSKPVEFAQYLHRLFPSLRNLEGPCDDSQGNLYDLFECLVRLPSSNPRR